MRTGIGYDIHRLVPSVEPSQICLGGVLIPCLYKIEAHSDGDVLLHALVDACLGALALGDIGQWFPENKPENRHRASSEFVREVLAKVHSLGWRVANFDAVVLLQEPKIAPYVDQIRASIATLLKTELSSISVKGKTGEGVGPIGEKRAIATHAVVTLVPT